MTIVHCPRCRDEVTVPAKASPKALVRCPLCLEEYLLAEALAALPPALIVVGDEEAEDVALVGAGVAGAEVGGEYGMAGDTYGAAFDSSPAAGATVAPSRTVVRGAPRPKKKPRSAVVELIKIVGGGVIGLGLGVLALWWVFGIDVGLGPSVAPYAPWIVPAKFRGTPQPDSGTTAQVPTGVAGQNVPLGGNPPGGKNSPSTAGNLTAANPGGGLIANDPTMPAGNSLTSSPSAVEPASIDLPFEPIPTIPTIPEVNPGVGTAAPANPGNGKTTAKPASSDPAGVDLTDLLPNGSPKPATTDPAARPAPGTENSPPAVSAADLTTAVESANEALTKVEEATANKEPKEVRQQRFTELFLAVANAGRVISHLDPADAEVAEPLNRLKGFLAQLAAQPGKVSAFGHLGRTHLPQRKPDDGFVIAGRVADIRAAGSVFETTLDAGSDLSVTVVSVGNPQDFCQIGDQLLVAGRIVDEPAKNIKGYEGDATRVMLLGDVAQIPKAE